MTNIIVLDLDDTLYLERDYALSGYRAVGQWLIERYGIAGFADRAVRQFTAGNRTHVFNEALGELGVAPSAGLIAELVAVYRAHRPDIHLLPDAKRFLDRRPAGCALALLTDGFLVAQRSKIRALGLRDGAIRPIVCTDIWGRAFWKPHHRGFQHIANHFAYPADRFIYVADNPMKDFIAPQALGWATVHICRGDGIYCHRSMQPGQAASITIETLDELTDPLIGALTAGRRR